MQEAFWNRVPVRGRGHSDVIGYEHSVGVLLPYRRYNPDAQPRAAEGSSSRIELDDDETWYGRGLRVVRRSVLHHLPPDEEGAMMGELAEAWATMTYPSFPR